MFWAIVLVGLGVTSPSVVYVGQFQEDATCQVALKDLQRQGFKGTCVQMIKPQVATEVGKK
jgi:hypothetical protein